MNEKQTQQLQEAIKEFHPKILLNPFGIILKLSEIKTNAESGYHTVGKKDLMYNEHYKNLYKKGESFDITDLSKVFYHFELMKTFSRRHVFCLYLKEKFKTLSQTELNALYDKHAGDLVKRETVEALYKDKAFKDVKLEDVKTEAEKRKVILK